MNVLLISPPRRHDSYFVPPTSLLYISHAIRAAGHKAEIIDIPYLLEKFHGKYSLLDGSLYEHIFSKDCDVLGLGGLVSTYFFYDDFVPKFMARKKDVPIIVGGSVGWPIKDVWAKHVPVDYIVEGYGEFVIQNFMKCLQNGDQKGIEEIPGLHYFKDGHYEGSPPKRINNLDNIPILDYDELDYEYYIDELTRWVEDLIPERSVIKADELRVMPLITSRGCPFQCSFCFHWDRRHIHHSVDYVIEQIKLFKKKYDVNCCFIIDDLFIYNRKYTLELCERIAAEDLSMYFFGSGGKPSLITEDMLAVMKKAGFIRFSYGIESGSQKMLDVMNKHTTVEQNLNAIKLTRDKGIPPMANICYGMPRENAQTLKETRDFLIKAELSSKHYYGAWATAYPGSPLFSWMQKQGIVKDTREYLFEVGSIGQYIYNFSDLSKKELFRRVEDIAHDADIAYYLRNKQLRRFINKISITYLKRLIRPIYQRIDPGMRQKIKNNIMNILGKKDHGKMKRSKKRSSEDIEKWIKTLKYLNKHRSCLETRNKALS